MNSKGEWRSNKISRLQVDSSEWEKKADLAADKNEDCKILAGIEKIKSKRGKDHSVSASKCNRGKKKSCQTNPSLVQVAKRPNDESKVPVSKRLCYEKDGQTAVIRLGKPSIALILEEEGGQRGDTCHGRPGIASTPELSFPTGKVATSPGRPSIASNPVVEVLNGVDGVNMKRKCSSVTPSPAPVLEITALTKPVREFCTTLCQRKPGQREDSVKNNSRSYVVPELCGKKMLPPNVKPSSRRKREKKGTSSKTCKPQSNTILKWLRKTEADKTVRLPVTEDSH